MKRYLLAACLTLFAPLALAAPPSQASIEKLLSVMHAKQVLADNLANLDGAVRRSMAQSLRGYQITPQGQEVLNSFSTKFVAAVRKEITWDKVKPHYVQIYTQTFTQEEINGLLAFYATPVGQSFVKKMPVVSAKTAAAVQQLMAPVVMQMRGAMQEAIAQAKSAK